MSNEFYPTGVRCFPVSGGYFTPLFLVSAQM